QSRRGERRSAVSTWGAARLNGGSVRRTEGPGKGMHIEIETKDNGFLSPEVTGLPESIQAAAIMVRCGKVSQRYIVVTAVQPPLTPVSIEAALGALFPGSIVS